MCMIAVVGILAAIALPAYQTYITRSKVAEGLELVSVTRDALTRNIEAYGHLPDADKIQSALSIADNDIIASVEPGDAGRLTVTFHEAITADPNQTVILQAQLSHGTVSWDCTGGTLINRYRPPKCRNKNVDGDSTSTAAQRNKTVFSNDRMLRIDVPRRWSSVLDLGEIASIQTGHLRDEQYFMVIEEAMSDMPNSIEVRNIAELMAEDLSESLDNGVVVQGATPFNINGHQAFLYEVHGSANGYPIVYRVAYLATEMHFYQLMAWTLKTNYDVAKPVFDKVMQSFQALSIDQ